MRVVRVQGCLPTLLFLLLAGATVAFLFTAGAVFALTFGALALAAAILRAVLGPRRGAPPPRPPPPGAARHAVVEAEGGTVDAQREGTEQARLPGS